jgi:hypothetical protein
MRMALPVRRLGCFTKLIEQTESLEEDEHGRQVTYVCVRTRAYHVVLFVVRFFLCFLFFFLRFFFSGALLAVGRRCGRGTSGCCCTANWQTRQFLRTFFDQLLDVLAFAGIDYFLCFSVVTFDANAGEYLRHCRYIGISVTCECRENVGGGVAHVDWQM